MQAAKPNTLERFFGGLSQHVFHTQLGVVDPQIVDYVSHLLVRFVRLDGITRIRQPDGAPVTEVVTMVAEAERRVGEAKRDVHRHIGDFTLFWSGVYPEALREMRNPSSSDCFVSYCAQGKRAYEIASTIETEKDDPPASLLQRLADQFEMCAYGLREIRREWERRDDAGSSDVPLLL
ncbi:MAG: hypothetical protein KatS3mg111_2222 [Pirellulaceae bacterium]|nr:MAG: hypothetical protein KatS3mg111_2222 [Pirellulaceae bacterium]